MKHIALIAVCLCLLAAIPAEAKTAAPSSPCSDKPVKAGPLQLVIAGKTVPLTNAQIRISQTNKIGGVTYSDYDLVLADSDNPDKKVEILVMSKEGENLSGKVFRKFPVDDMNLQPHPPEEGGVTPEIQSVEIDSDTDGINYHFGVLSAVRVEFTKQDAGQIAGQVRVCMKGGQFDKAFLTKPTQEIHLEGSFTATLTK